MSRQRDDKGRFEKGNTEGNRFKSNGEATEAGRKGGIASQEAQHRRKLLRETLMEELSKETAKGSGVFCLQVGSQSYPLAKDGVKIAQQVGFTVEDIRPLGGATSSSLHNNTDDDEENEKIIILRK